DGDYTPIAGHGMDITNPDGGFYNKPITVPDGVELVVFVSKGGALRDDVGQMIDQGQDISQVDRDANFEGVFTIKPGDTIEDLTFYPGSGYDLPELNIGDGAVTVDRPRSLSEMIEQMGPGRYAISTCRVEGHAPSVPIDAGRNRDAPQTGDSRSLEAGQGNSNKPESDAEIRKVAREQTRDIVNDKLDDLVKQLTERNDQTPRQTLETFADNNLQALKDKLAAQGAPTDWLTRDAVIDLISQDPDIQRKLQTTARDNGLDPRALLEASAPAARLADKLKQADSDRERLKAIRDTLERLGNSTDLLTSTQGDALLRSLKQFDGDASRTLAMQMLTTGKVLDVSHEGFLFNSRNRVNETTTSLDGSEPVRDRAPLVDELYLLTSTLDSKDDALIRDQNRRMSGVKSDIEKLRNDLARAQEQLKSLPEGSPEHQQAKEQLDKLRTQAEELDKTFGQNAHLLATLADHDAQWFRDSFLPVVNAGRGREIDPDGGPQTPEQRRNDSNATFWRDNRQNAENLAKQGSRKARETLDQVIKQAQQMEADGKGNAREALQRFAAEYSDQHGSFTELLQKASKDRGLLRNGQDNGEYARLAQAFGIDRSAGVDAAQKSVPHKLSFEQEQKVAAAAEEAAQIVKRVGDSAASSLAARPDTDHRLAKAQRELQQKLQDTIPELANNPDAARAMAQDVMRATFESRYGSLNAHLAKVRETLIGSGGNVDSLREFGVDPARGGELTQMRQEREALAKGGEALAEYQRQNGIDPSTQLDPHVRADLYDKAGGRQRDVDAVFKTILEADAKTRKRILDDPLLLQRMAEGMPEVYPLLHDALSGRISPRELLPTLVALKNAKGLGIDPITLLTGDTGKLASLDVAGYLKGKIKAVTSAFTDGVVNQVTRRRMKENVAEGIKSYMEYEKARLKAEMGLTDSDADQTKLKDAMRDSALELMADGEFMALLDDNFSAEQKAELLSMLLNDGDVAAQDAIRRDRANPFEERQNIIDTLKDADEDALARLRRDPAILDQLQKLSQGERLYATHLLMDTPAAKVLKEIADWKKMGSTRSWDVVSAIANLDQKQRNSLRDDPALVEFLATKVDDARLPYFRELMGVDERNLAVEPGQNQSPDAQLRDFEQTRIVTGLTVAMSRGDYDQLLDFATSAYSKAVERPVPEGTAKPDPDATPDPAAQQAEFDRQVREGHLGQDILSKDGTRQQIADQLRTSPEFRELMRKRPDIAAAVIDGVLGERDPALTKYQNELSKQSFLASPDADTLVENMKAVSGETFLREFVNLPDFAPVAANYMAAKADLEAARRRPDSDPDKAGAVTAAEQALNQAKTEMDAFPFDLSPARAAELDA
ncbi:MAG: putative adhesin, partial [Myxococcota bacterium]